MMPVTAPADKRFRRAHVRPGRRRWLRWSPQFGAAAAFAALLCGYAGYRAYAWVQTSGMLRVSRITVDGNERMSSGEVAAVLDGAVGSDMLGIDLEDWRDKLLRAPWVAGVEIRRVLPGTLAVSIDERRPMGVGRLGDALYLIDDTGTIIDEFGPNYAEFDLPVIDGLVSPQGGDTLVDGGRAALVGRLLVDLDRRPDLARRVSQIDVSDVRDAVLILKDDATHVRVGTSRFVERLQSYLDLAPRLREHAADIEYVDLRFDERVYVRPRSGTRVAPVLPASGPGERARARAPRKEF